MLIDQQQIKPLETERVMEGVYSGAARLASAESGIQR